MIMCTQPYYKAFILHKIWRFEKDFQKNFLVGVCCTFKNQTHKKNILKFILCLEFVFLLFSSLYQKHSETYTRVRGKSQWCSFQLL